MDEVLDDIEVPSLDVPDLDVSFCSAAPAKDLFAEKKRAAWKDVQQAEARCDFAPNKVRISYRNPAFGIISLWKKSVYGRTLTDIKADPDMVEKFAEGMNTLIGKSSAIRSPPATGLSLHRPNVATRSEILHRSFLPGSLNFSAYLSMKMLPIATRSIVSELSLPSAHRSQNACAARMSRRLKRPTSSSLTILLLPAPR